MDVNQVCVAVVAVIAVLGVSACGGSSGVVGDDERGEVRASELVGAPWVAIAYSDIDTAPAELGTRLPTVRFFDEAETARSRERLNEETKQWLQDQGIWDALALAAHDSCNTGSGWWHLNGDRLESTASNITEIGCPGVRTRFARGLWETLSAEPTVGRVEDRPGSLLLSSPDRQIAFVRTDRIGQPPSTKELTGRWTLGNARAASLTFDADGVLHAGSCAEMGTWTLTEGGVLGLTDVPDESQVRDSCFQGWRTHLAELDATLLQQDGATIYAVNESGSVVAVLLAQEG